MSSVQHLSNICDAFTSSSPGCHRPRVAFESDSASFRINRRSCCDCFSHVWLIKGEFWSCFITHHMLARLSFNKRIPCLDNRELVDLNTEYCLFMDVEYMKSTCVSLVVCCVCLYTGCVWSRCERHTTESLWKLKPRRHPCQKVVPFLHCCRGSDCLGHHV